MRRVEVTRQRLLHCLIVPQGELEKQREERKKEYERLRQESDALRNKRDEIVNEIQALNKESVTHRQKMYAALRPIPFRTLFQIVLSQTWSHCN